MVPLCVNLCMYIILYFSCSETTHLNCFFGVVAIYVQYMIWFFWKKSYLRSKTVGEMKSCSQTIGLEQSAHCEVHPGYKELRSGVSVCVFTILCIYVWDIYIEQNAYHMYVCVVTKSTAKYRNISMIYREIQLLTPPHFNLSSLVWMLSLCEVLDCRTASKVSMKDWGEKESKIAGSYIGNIERTWKWGEEGVGIIGENLWNKKAQNQLCWLTTH